MGNSPSTSKPTTPSSSTHDSPKLPKREPRSIITPGQQRVAIPPEQSMAHATGSNISNPQSRSVPTFPTAGGGGSSGSGGSGGPSGTNTAHTDSLTRTNSGSSASRPEPSKPVAVPIAHTEPSSLRSHHSDHVGGSHHVGEMGSGMAGEPGIPNTESVQDMSYLTRPPRLPLPIEEEIHTPGSPIIAPVGTGEPLEGLDNLDGAGSASDPELARNTSVLSQSTQEDDDEEELRVERHRPTVPTRIEWARGGDRVYVTGTIFNWNRKTRLHPVDGKPGVFSAIISILPGTHHLRFLVDNVMTTSPDLPTTVDFGNNLVNYIEVSPDDISNVAAAEATSAITARREGEEPKPGQEEAALRRKRQAPPIEAYTKEISQFLLDYDQTEENQDYIDGCAAVEKLPGPPSLPGFLGKPILNSQSLVKDDNSVLTMPNHTVLNHLATSSIKHNILAVSATTRYRNKYVTTIVYKPAQET
ncbi:putative carbohydrate-binding module family 48 protein [Zalerion maritima]|uniref:Carbohydrate-binding module family 48 protein n=1 Tax=Zalerion maritima TaxID=339359 RepID=A0AAD5RPK0_9PEZI|nr:putative carbohydrate-binding module family 48 protein [Zalerion maritima]